MIITKNDIFEWILAGLILLAILFSVVGCEEKDLSSGEWACLAEKCAELSSRVEYLEIVIKEISVENCYEINEPNDEEICAYIEGGWPEDWESRLNGIWLTIGPKKGIPDEWTIKFENPNEPADFEIVKVAIEPNKPVDNYFTLKRRNQHKLTVKVNEPYFQAHFERYFPGVGVPDDLNKGNEYGEPRLVLDLAILMLEQRIKALEARPKARKSGFVYGGIRKGKEQ
jgi:hypothetical protein